MKKYSLLVIAMLTSYGALSASLTEANSQALVSNGMLHDIDHGVTRLVVCVKGKKDVDCDTIEWLSQSENNRASTIALSKEKDLVVVVQQNGKLSISFSGILDVKAASESDGEEKTLKHRSVCEFEILPKKSDSELKFDNCYAWITRR